MSTVDTAKEEFYSKRIKEAAVLHAIFWACDNLEETGPYSDRDKLELLLGVIAGLRKDLK